MRHLTWSFLERIFPRASSAILMLVLTHFVGPAVVGVYAWAVLGLTLVQSVSDGAVRQIAVIALRSDDGRAFLRTYVRWSSWLGPAVLALLLVLLAALLPADLRPQALLVAPLVLVPVVQAARVWPVATLQTTGRWSTLARAQLVAALGSFALSLPLLVATGSLVACSLQVMVTELLLTLSIRRSARLLPDLQPGSATRGTVVREFWHLVLYTLFGWLQGQSDRILLAWFTTTSRLGLYSLAWSMSRSVGDSVSFSTSNVLRPRVATHLDAPAPVVRAAADSVLLRAVALSSVLVVVTAVGARVVLPHLLSAEWSAAIEVVPVMALSALPTLLAWSMTPILTAARRMRWAAPIKSVGIVLALPVALAAREDLTLAAWFLVGREVVVLVLMVAATGRYTPWRAVLAGGAALAVLSLGAWLSY